MNHKVITTSAFLIGTFTVFVFPNESFASTRLDVGIGGAVEIFVVKEKPDALVNIGTLGGGGMLAGISGEWFKPASFGFGLDLGFEKFRSNAKLEQEQFGVLEKGTFELGSTLVSVSPFVAWHLGDDKRLLLGVGYDQGFASYGKLKIGVLDFAQKIQKISRYGSSLAFEIVLWKGLTLGAKGAFKLGKYVSEVEDLTNGTVENQNFDFKNYTAALTMGWRFPFEQSEGGETLNPNAVPKKQINVTKPPVSPKVPAKKVTPVR